MIVASEVEGVGARPATRLLERSAEPIMSGVSMVSMVNGCSRQAGDFYIAGHFHKHSGRMEWS